MQLINICTIAIELFGAAYFVVALAAHLRHCWANPHIVELQRFDRKLAAVELPAEVPPLLPPAAELLEIAEGVSAIEVVLTEVAATIEAVEVTIAPVAEPMWTDAIVPFRRRQPKLDYQAMTSQQLRKICGDRGIRWRNAHGSKHLSKLQMLIALS